jgi:hypothetical protein
MHKLLSNTTASLAQSLFKVFVVVRLTIGLIYLAKICMEEVAKQRVHIKRRRPLMHYVHLMFLTEQK